MESEIDTRIKEFVEGSKSLRIFIFGKTGVGKSSLVNTLLGTERAEEGAGIFSQTKSVASYTEGGSSLHLSSIQVTVNDVEITVWDSPGLRDPFTDEKLTIEEIKKNCKNIDLFIYCTPFNQTRIGQDDFDSISALSNGLGNDIWNKALIALTFANEVNLSKVQHQGSTEQKFDKRVSDWKEALKYALVKAGVKKEVAEGVPIVPASYRDMPIPDSGMNDWFSVFWNECLKRIKFLSMPAFLKVQKENTSLMEEAMLTLKEHLATVEFKTQLQTQMREGSEQENKVLATISPELLRDPTYIASRIARVLYLSELSRIGSEIQPR